MKNNKTGIMNMQEEIERLTAELDKIKSEREKPYAERYYGKALEKEVPKKKSPPEMPEFLKETDVPKNIHGPDTDVSRYVTKQQAKAKLFRKLAGALGKTAKIGAPLLGIASDVLASEDLDDAEISPEEIKRMQIEKELTPKDLEIKQSLEEKAKSLKPSDSIIDDLTDDNEDDKIEEMNRERIKRFPLLNKKLLRKK